MQGSICSHGLKFVTNRTVLVVTQCFAVLKVLSYTRINDSHLQMDSNWSYPFCSCWRGVRSYTTGLNVLLFVIGVFCNVCTTDTSVPINTTDQDYLFN
jgi:hypothetical protein